MAFEICDFRHRVRTRTGFAKLADGLQDLHVIRRSHPKSEPVPMEGQVFDNTSHVENAQIDRTSLKDLATIRGLKANPLVLDLIVMDLRVIVFGAQVECGGRQKAG